MKVRRTIAAQNGIQLLGPILDLAVARGIGRSPIARKADGRSSAPLTVGGSFIGDYIEVFAHNGRALISFNANYRSEQLMSQGLPIPQQDNFLARTRSRTRY